MNTELLYSKSWKERLAFYTSLTWSSPDLSILNQISKETTVPALEAALNSILSYPQPNYAESKQILKNVNVTKLKPLFIKYFIKHYGEAQMIEDIEENIRTLKLAKTVVFYCEMLQYLVDNYKVCMFNKELLEVVLKNGDPGVRKEGVKLCVCVYLIEGEKVFLNLQNVKDIQIKEIKERIDSLTLNTTYREIKNDVECENDKKLIDKVISHKENIYVKKTFEKQIGIGDEKLEKCIGSSNQQSTHLQNNNTKASQNHDVNEKYNTDNEQGKVMSANTQAAYICKPFLQNYRSISRKSNQPENLTDQLKSSNYKERLEALTTIQDTSITLNNEAQALVIQKIGDVNLQVSTLAIECSVLFNVSKELVRALCEKLKDKKLKNVILYVMNELKITNTDIFECLNLCKCKNPIMKASLLEYVRHGTFEKSYVEEINKLTVDGNKDVRQMAYECCKAIYNTKHRKILPEKILERCSSEVCDNLVAESIINEVKQEEKIEEGSYEYFSSKYPFLKGISSTDRFYDIAKSNIHDDKHFIKFCCTYVDSYYKINVYLLEKLMKKQIHESKYSAIVFAYLSRLNDIKLKSLIKDLIHYLYKENSIETVKALRLFLENTKSGTLFCEAMTIYNEIGVLQDILYLERLDRVELLEKNAIHQTIKNIKDRYTQSNNTASSPSITNKRKHFATKSVIIRQKISNRCKDCKNKEILFTDEFVEMLGNKHSYKKVLSLFEQEDMISLSDFIIEYIEKHDLFEHDHVFAKKYLNGFLDLLIEKECILKEIEAKMLCEILKNDRKMLSKLPLIYPKSKLERFILNQDKLNSLNTSFLSLNVESSYVNSPCKKSKRTNVLIKPEKINFNNGENDRLDETKIFKKYENITELQPFGPFTSTDLQKGNIEDKVRPQDKNYFENINGSIDKYCKSTPADTQNASVVLDEIKLKKYSLEMSHYKKEIVNVDKLALERILADLIESNHNRSEKAFIDLNTVIDTNISSLYFSRNAIISSIIMQLSECIFTRNKFSTYILSTLLKLCRDIGFVADLSMNAVKTINIDMINIIKEQKNEDSQNIANINLASEVLLSVCANGDRVVVFKVYLLLFELIDGDARKLLYKLVCRHSKHTKSIYDDKPKIQEIIDALNVFLEDNCLKIIKNDVVAIKVIQLHVNEFCLHYRNRIFEFRLEGLVKRIVDKTMGKVKVEIEDVKKRIEDLQKQ